MKIYLSVTTFPKRIKYFKTFYDNIYSGSIKPYKIILNIYNRSIRNELLIIPKELETLENLIIIKNDKDYGPILKFLSIYEKFINSDDIFIYCDDDIEYSNNWLEILTDSIKKNPSNISAISINSGVNIINRFRYLQYNNNNIFLRGYGGVGFFKKCIELIRKNEILNLLENSNNINLYFSDDLVISYFVNKYNIDSTKVNYDIKLLLKEYEYNKFTNDSISKGINNNILSNKIRYYNLCNNYKFIGDMFCLKTYLFGNENKYKNDFYKIYYKIINNEKFALIRFGDGEIRSIRYKTYKHIEYCVNNKDNNFTNNLKETLLFNNTNYIKGIPCICCEKKDNFRIYIKNHLNVNVNNCTFANIFNNSNYFYFKKDILPLFKKFKVILVSNKNSNINNLNLNIIKWFPIDKNAHNDYKNINKEIINFTKNNNISDHLFLFCAGAVSNIIIYELFKLNKSNIYLDLGSLLDTDLGLKNTRNYNSLYGWKSLATCNYNNINNSIFNISCYSQNKSKFLRFILKIYALLTNTLYNFILLCKDIYSYLFNEKNSSSGTRT